MNSASGVRAKFGQQVDKDDIILYMLFYSVFFNTANVYPGVRANSCQHMDKDDIIICSLSLFSLTLPMCILV